MNAFDLLQQTQKDFVNSDDSVSESIVYNHSDLTVSQIKAFPEFGEFEVKEKNDTSNECIFHNVILPKTPTKLDTITYNGLSWKVRHWKYQGGLYIIYTDNAKRARMTQKEGKR